MAGSSEDNPEQNSGEPPEVSLPNKEELSRLTPEAMVAYAARCAMRVQPLLGDASFGGTRLEQAVGHLRAAEVAVTLAAASSVFPDVARLAGAYGQHIAVGARRASKAAQGKGAVAAEVAASAADAAKAVGSLGTGATMRSKVTGSTLYAASAAASSAAAAAAARADFNTLLQHGAGPEGTKLVFGRSPFWPSMPLSWDRVVAEWSAGLRKIGLSAIAERYQRMLRGKGIDWGGAKRRINNWLEKQQKQPGERTRSGKKKKTKVTPVTEDDSPSPSEEEEDSKTSASKENEPTEEVVATDKVRAHDDEPATIDLLNRKAFAGALAERIRSIRESKYDGAFLINLHGPWGSGKSTLLNFIEDDLTGETAGDDRWLPVRFNTWEKQSAGPAWWTLMDSVYRQALKKLWKDDESRAVWFALGELWWRFSVRRGYLLIAAVVVLWIIIAILWQVPTAKLAENAKTISTILGAVVTFGGIVFAATRTLFAGTAHAAKSFSDAARSPTRKITEHFGDLLARIRRPVIIMIDDLDRCQGDYVVELLESTQTLYRQGRVTYVIAADRRWLCASYQKRYEHFGDALDEPGRPLGYLFLEKIFQLSATVPRLAPPVKAQFWRRLLDIEKEAPVDQDEAPMKKALAEAETELEGITDEKEVMRRVEALETGSIRGMAMGQAAAKWTAKPEAIKRTEHALLPYSVLLDGNPRSMKRLVNAYGVLRAVCILARIHIEAGPLTRWTILALRWPVLAERLRGSPELIDYIGDAERIDRETDAKTLPAAVAELRPLFVDNDVLRVVSYVYEGAGAETVLTKEVLELLVTLRSGEGEEGDVVVA